MGKKKCPRMMKISKNSEKKQEVNSLIGVLRPKVYITDISSFKRLVQELTGNGGATVLSPSSSPARPRTISEKVLVADHMADEENNNSEISMDASVDSSLDLHNQDLLWMDQTVDTYRDLESWLLDIY